MYAICQAGKSWERYYPVGNIEFVQNFDPLTAEAIGNFLWLVFPQFLSILFVSAAILRLVNTEIIRRNCSTDGKGPG